MIDERFEKMDTSGLPAVRRTSMTALLSIIYCVMVLIAIIVFILSIKLKLFAGALAPTMAPIFLLVTPMAFVIGVVGIFSSPRWLGKFFCLLAAILSASSIGFVILVLDGLGGLR
jgi:hypothetical protein